MARPNNLLIHRSTLVFLLATSFVLINANDNTVRLKNKFDTATNKGRVEIFYADAWGTICDDDWDILDADVVCRQLGYTGAIRALKGGYFGPGENLIWIDNVGCTGNETRIQDCPNSGWGSHNCVHLEDASVECSRATVRLVGGPDRYEGNVQVLDDNVKNRWGYVCDDRWDDLDAQVACNQLDQRQSDYTRDKSTYGTETDGPFFLNNLDCAGNEYTLQQCPKNSGIKNCTRFDKAGVGCTRDEIEDGSVRLAGNTGYPNRGRVEIYHNGEWGTVCDDFWDYYDAKVVCRQLGYISSQPKAYYKSYFGAGQGRIWLDNMACGGGEERLENCISSNGWGAHDCSHSEDAGVYCDERGEFDAAEITGIILASLFGASILFCCVKYICCEAASNKRQQRRRRSRRQSRRSPTASARPTDPEDHFNAHFNNAYTISDNHDEIFTPPGFPYAYPSSAPPPFTPTDLPPAYETIMSTSGPADSGTPVTSGDTATGNSVNASDVVANPTATAPAPPQSTASVNAGPVPMPESNSAYPPAQPASNLPYPPEPVMSQQQAPTPANPPAAMPPIEAVVPPPYAMSASRQLEEKKEPLSPSSSCQPTYQVPIESQFQQSPAAPSPVKSVNVAETSATDDQAHAHPNTFEETSITYVANAEESIDLGLPNDNS